MESVESQIAEWRAYVANAPGVNGHDVDELEDHLRHQIAELNAAGLTDDEGFLIAVKRLGDVDGLSREFAREHSGRLWKQLVLAGDDEPARGPSGWLEAFVFAVGAAVAIQVARLAAGFPDDETDLVRAEPQPVRVAVPRRVLRPPTAARHAAMGADGGAVRARRARGQPLSVRCGLGHRGPRRAPSARRALVRRSPTRTWVARSDRTSGAWTSSASRANGSSTTC